MSGWNGLDVARWFATAAGAAGLATDVLVPWHVSWPRKGIFGGGSIKTTEGAPEPAWIFDKAVSPESRSAAYVFPDGRLGHGEPGRWVGPGNPTNPDTRLRACALLRMAELLNLDFRQRPPSSATDAPETGRVPES